MKTNVLQVSAFALLVLISSCDQKEKLLTEKINQINSELSTLIDENYKEKVNDPDVEMYKDTTFEMILVKERVGWNGSSSGDGTFAFDDKLGMVILNAEAISSGEQRYSFSIKEVLPANFRYFQEKEENEFSNKFKKINTGLEAKFEWKGTKYLDAVGKFNFLNQKFKQNYSYFKERIETSNATVRYEWSVRGNNQYLNRLRGKLDGGLKVTLRKFKEPESFKNFSQIEAKLSELEKFIKQME